MTMKTRKPRLTLSGKVRKVKPAEKVAALEKRIVGLEDRIAKLEKQLWDQIWPNIPLPKVGPPLPKPASPGPNLPPIFPWSPNPIEPPIWTITCNESHTTPHAIES